jgi:hypothetical protein
MYSRTKSQPDQPDKLGHIPPSQRLAKIRKPLCFHARQMKTHGPIELGSKLTFIQAQPQIDRKRKDR